MVCNARIEEKTMIKMTITDCSWKVRGCDSVVCHHENITALISIYTSSLTRQFRYAWISPNTLASLCKISFMLFSFTFFLRCSCFFTLVYTLQSQINPVTFLHPPLYLARSFFFFITSLPQPSLLWIVHHNYLNSSTITTSTSCNRTIPLPSSLSFLHIYSFLLLPFIPLLSSAYVCLLRILITDYNVIHKHHSSPRLVRSHSLSCQSNIIAIPPPPWICPSFPLPTSPLSRCPHTYITLPSHAPLWHSLDFKWYQLFPWYSVIIFIYLFFFINPPTQWW